MRLVCLGFPSNSAHLPWSVASLTTQRAIQFTPLDLGFVPSVLRCAHPTAYPDLALARPQLHVPRQ
jgi:hypothetical protein